MLGRTESKLIREMLAQDNIRLMQGEVSELSPLDARTPRIGFGRLSWKVPKGKVVRVLLGFCWKHGGEIHESYSIDITRRVEFPTCCSTCSYPSD